MACPNDSRRHLRANGDHAHEADACMEALEAEDDVLISRARLRKRILFPPGGMSASKWRPRSMGSDLK
jgi:hypothetical protein